MFVQLESLLIDKEITMEQEDLATNYMNTIQEDIQIADMIVRTEGYDGTKNIGD